jgi:protease-4
MTTQKTSIVIIALCVLSLIVGIFNSAVKPAVQEEKAPQQKAKDFIKEISSTEEKIALISLEGPISADTSSSFVGDIASPESALKSLDKAIDDNSVKGVVLRVNSPGGTVAMSQEIYHTVLRLREKKPVIVSMADVAASGGYYIASAADRIYADEGTLTGSIGVIMSTLNVQDLMSQKLGIKSVVIKSGKFKDTGSMYRQMRPDEQALMQNLVNSAYHQFVKAITNGRIKRTDDYKVAKAVLTEQNLKQYADGRVLTGEQAKKYGFVDSLGGLHEAKAAARKMAKQKFPTINENIPVIVYNKPTGFSEMFFGMTESILPQKKLEAYLPFSINYPRQPLFMWE